jgi:hypothetical protein
MIHDVYDIVKLSYGRSQRILSNELNMRRIAAKSAPRLLSNNQKGHCIAICSQLKEQTENDPNFISTIITGDESWVYGYDRDETAIISVEDAKFTATQESTTSSKQCQINVDLVF